MEFESELKLQSRETIDYRSWTRRKRNQTNSICGNLHAALVKNDNCSGRVALLQLQYCCRHSNVAKAALCFYLFLFLNVYFCCGYLVHGCCTFGALSPHSHLPATCNLQHGQRQRQRQWQPESRRRRQVWVFGFGHCLSFSFGFSRK